MGSFAPCYDNPERGSEPLPAVAVRSYPSQGFLMVPGHQRRRRASVMRKPRSDHRIDSLSEPLHGANARELERLARWMDSVFEIPGLGLRFGLDSLLGLLPGGGDVATSIISIYILSAATRHGVPRVTLLRMALNIAIDLVVGAVPIVGDLFDVYWKANQRNVELLHRHVDATPAAARKLRATDRWFVVGLAALLGVVLIASVAAAYFVVAWLVTILQRSG